jgi:hypothetical protein
MTFTEGMQLGTWNGIDLVVNPKSLGVRFVPGDLQPQGSPDPAALAGWVSRLQQLPGPVWHASLTTKKPAGVEVLKGLLNDFVRRLVVRFAIQFCSSPVADNLGRRPVVPAIFAVGVLERDGASGLLHAHLLLGGFSNEAIRPGWLLPAAELLWRAWPCGQRRVRPLSGRDDPAFGYVARKLAAGAPLIEGPVNLACGA